jgi:hypothetical protein
LELCASRYMLHLTVTHIPQGLFVSLTDITSASVAGANTRGSSKSNDSRLEPPNPRQDVKAEDYKQEEEFGPQVSRWLRRDYGKEGPPTIHIGLIAKNVAGSVQGQ